MLTENKCLPERAIYSNNDCMCTLCMCTQPLIKALIGFWLRSIMVTSEQSLFFKACSGHKLSPPPIYSVFLSHLISCTHTLTLACLHSALTCRVSLVTDIHKSIKAAASDADIPMRGHNCAIKMFWTVQTLNMGLLKLQTLDVSAVVNVWELDRNKKRTDLPSSLKWFSKCSRCHESYWLTDDFHILVTFFTVISKLSTCLYLDSCTQRSNICFKPAQWITRIVTTPKSAD